MMMWSFVVIWLVGLRAVLLLGDPMWGGSCGMLMGIVGSHGWWILEGSLRGRSRGNWWVLWGSCGWWVSVGSRRWLLLEGSMDLMFGESCGLCVLGG